MAFGGAINISADLGKGNASEPKKILENAYNSLSKFNKGLQNVCNVIVFGRPDAELLKQGQQITPIDFRKSPERKKLMASIRNIGSNPSLLNTTRTLQVLNSYDLCNPLQFVVSQVFPADSPVANILGEAQEFIDKIVGTFRGSSLIEGGFEIEATTTFDILSQEIESLPFQRGNIVLVTLSSNLSKINFNSIDLENPTDKTNLNRDKDKLANGTYLTIEQTDDPKIGATMRGPIINSNPYVDENTGVVTGTEYVIAVESINPQKPPYERDNKGNPLLADNGEPILATYQNFIISGEKKLSANAKDIGGDLVDISNDLRGLDFITLNNIVQRIPSSIKGVSKFKKAIKDISDEIEDINKRTSRPTDTIQTVGGVLSTGITVEEAISKSRKLREAYRQILPFTNIKFAVQEKFKNEIEDINRALRDFIPYEDLANIFEWLSKRAKELNMAIDFVLALIITVNTVIKIVIIVLKVIRVIVKILELFIKAIPIPPFVPIKLVEAPTNTKKTLVEAVSRAIDLLTKIAKEFDITIGLLTFVRFYIEQFLRENAKLAAKLESCRKVNQAQDDLQSQIDRANKDTYLSYVQLIEGIPGLDKFEFGQFGAAVSNRTGSNTFVRLENGNLLIFPDTVFGYDENGNLLFYGELSSLATGVSFEDTLGQDFRSRLQYYTFNKFDAAKHGPLIQSADDIYLDNQNVADPEDAFGNFQEIFLGFTLKIQEDKPIDKNKNDLLRRRGIALDSDNNIVAATNLTFSDDLPGIINELKYKVKVRLNQGIIGINTLDKESNEISDNDAVSLAEDLGTNPIFTNNLKAGANNRSIGNISSGQAGNEIEGKPIDPNEPIETRIGGGPFVKDPYMGDGDTLGASSTQDGESNSRFIDTTTILSDIIQEQQDNDPKVQAIKNTFSILNSVDPNTINNLLKSPGSQNLSDTELFNTLKEQVLSTIDPNPVKVDEVKKKTEQWYKGLRESTLIEWEQLTQNYRPPRRPSPPPYETYFTQVEQQALPAWVRKLLRSGYTETEVQTGISDPVIVDKYRIKIGPESSKVEVTLRLAFRR
eukprot:SAG11_NODE_41_length_21459_cov_5.742884_17_plen_1054_part_00